MKILMVSLDFLPTVGGITAHVYGLSKALVSLGHEVTVLTRKIKSYKNYEEVDGIDVYRVWIGGVGFLYGLTLQRAVKELIKNEKYDVIHIHGLRPLEFYNIAHPPLVFTNHTSGFLKRIQYGGWKLRLLERLMNKPKLIIAPSYELLEFPFKVRAIKRYIPNGIWIERYRREENERKKVREKLNVGSQLLGIVTRRMVKKNGVLVLAHALKYVKNQDFKLLFIGDGEEFDAVEAVLQKTFPNRYILLGSLPHEKIIPYYSAADFTILPSLMEATSISALEAMAASLPLVGTRVGGIPELIQDGVNGYLCEPNDSKSLGYAIDRLLQSDLLEMGQNSYEIVQDFDWMKIAKKTLEAYEEVI